MVRQNAVKFRTETLLDSLQNLGKLSMAALRNFNGLASWKNAENSLQSVNLTMPRRALDADAGELRACAGAPGRGCKS